MHPPILTGNDCEGAGETFTVEATTRGGTPFFHRPAYLTVSAQLHLEALAQSHGRVYTISPTFRAEASSSSRHLAEFYMCEAEYVPLQRLEDLVSIAEDLLRHVSDTIGPKVHSVQRVEYSDAITLLQQAPTPFDVAPTWGMDLQAEHERYLAEKVYQGPVAILRYPVAIKPFYMALSPGEKQTVENFDLIVPGVGELFGGSMRETSGDVLQKRLDLLGQGTAREKDASPPLEWYVDLRRYGYGPSGGFGVGIERLLAYLCGHANIRDVTFAPRWHGAQGLLL